jgi:hypothetical protein
LQGARSKKRASLNRGLQNLTAKYNILFNANEMLREKQEAMKKLMLMITPNY